MIWAMASGLYGNLLHDCIVNACKQGKTTKVCIFLNIFRMSRQSHNASIFQAQGSDESTDLSQLIDRIVEFSGPIHNPVPDSTEIQDLLKELRKPGK